MRSPTLRPNHNSYVSDGPSAEDLALACDIRDRILESEGDRVIKVVFYGSRAKGCPKPESDCELLVIMHDVTEENRPWEGDRLTNALISSRSFPVLPDIKVCSEEFFDAAQEEPGVVGYEAARPGIIIYAV